RRIQTMLKFMRASVTARASHILRIAAGPVCSRKISMPLPSLPVLGVRFDIDKLLKYSGGNYAETAWTIIWQSLDPSLLKGATLWHGDSSATLNHRENVFCIAIQSSDAGSLKQAQSILAGSSELGGVAAVPLFAEGNDVIGEPLPGDGHIDFRGEIVGQSFHAR